MERNKQIETNKEVLISNKQKMFGLGVVVDSKLNWMYVKFEDGSGCPFNWSKGWRDPSGCFVSVDEV